MIVLSVDIILLGGPVWQGLSGTAGASTRDMSLESNDSSWSWDCSNTSDFIYNDSWNVAWYGEEWIITNDSMVSNGNTVSFPSIGPGSGTHGPVYVHELADAFLLENLMNFEVKWSIDNSLTSYMGAYYVYLADSNRDPVTVILIHDWKAAEYAGSYGAQYYFSNGTIYAHGTPSPYAFTEFNGMIRAYYEPNVGVLGYFDGYSTSLITEVDESDLQREIRYVVVMGARFSSYALMPCYIDEVVLTWGTSEPRFSLWHEKCSDTARFSYNDSWNVGWYGGNWTIVDYSMTAVDGTFTFPVIGTETGWHGPVYVHELMSSFVLEDLEQFSVKWSIDNSLTSYMGAYYVYLADSNGDPVTVILIHDWKAAEYAGSYGGQYYFSNGTFYARGTPSPYAFTDFIGSVRIWYEAGYGIMSHCDGLGSGLVTEVGEEDLAREVKYVVIMGARCSSYSLMPINIDDISIIVRNPPDLTTTTTTATTTTSATTTTTDADTTGGFQFDMLTIGIAAGVVILVVGVACAMLGRRQ